MWILLIEVTRILLPLFVTSIMALLVIKDLFLTLVLPSSIRSRMGGGLKILNDASNSLVGKLSS
jgi:hypothetical protein